MNLRLKVILKHLAWFVLTAWRGRSFSPFQVRRGPAQGVVLNLDLRSQAAYWIGNYDSYAFERIPFQRYVLPGSSAWDCGAFVGYYTAVLRKYAGDAGRVHAIEASSQNFRALAELPRLNGWTNVAIHHAAVGAAHSTISFVANLGGASGPLSGRCDFGPTEQLKIEQVRCFGVDELLEHLGGQPPDFIKFDLEGAEVDALRNGPRLFRNFRPVLLLEIHGRAALEATAEFVGQFEYGAIPVHVFPSLKHCTSQVWLESLRAHAIHQSAAMLALSYLPHMLLMLPCEHPDWRAIPPLRRFSTAREHK